MNRIKVKSSTIIAIGYNEKEKLLEVEFKTATYRYSNVEKEVYDKFMKSESKGKFVWANINGRYRYEKIS